MSVCGIFKVVLLVLAFHATFYFDEVNARDVTSTSGFPNHPWSHLWKSIDPRNDLKISRNKRNLFGFFRSKPSYGGNRSGPNYNFYGQKIKMKGRHYLIF